MHDTSSFPPSLLPSYFLLFLLTWHHHLLQWRRPWYQLGIASCYCVMRQHAYDNNEWKASQVRKRERGKRGTWDGQTNT